jgi:hypothetical protein
MDERKSAGGTVLMPCPLRGAPWWLPSMQACYKGCESEAVEGIALTGRHRKNGAVRYSVRVRGMVQGRAGQGRTG